MLARVTAGADGRFELRPVEPLPDGAVEVHAVAIDAAGNVSAASDSLALTIDTTAPASPTLAGPGTAPVAEARPMLRGTAEPGAVVELRRGDTALARVTAGADGRFELRPDLALPEGAVEVHAVAIDAAGNVSAASGTLSLTIDTKAPASPTLMPPQGGGEGSSVINHVPTFEVRAVEADAKVELLRDGSVVANRIGPGMIADLGPVTDGRHNYASRQIDAAGNAGPIGPALTITIDTVAPSVTASLLATDDTGIKGDGRTAVTRPRLAGVAEAGASVELLDRDGAVIARTAADANDGTFRFLVPAVLPTGSAAFGVRATDAAGNVGALTTLHLSILAPPPGDYDGDRLTDFGIYHVETATASGRFDVELSSGGRFSRPVGDRSDIPIVGDYDGDGVSDIGVYRRGTVDMMGRFIVQLSSGGVLDVAFGGAGDLPVAGDYDGDGRTDLAVYGYSPLDGYSRFAIRPSSDPCHGYPVAFGGAGDLPVAGDYDGDGRPTSPSTATAPSTAIPASPSGPPPTRATATPSPSAAPATCPSPATTTATAAPTSPSTATAPSTATPASPSGPPPTRATATPSPSAAPATCPSPATTTATAAPTSPSTATAPSTATPASPSGPPPIRAGRSSIR